MQNCAARPAQKTGAIWGYGAVLRDAVWQWLMLYAFFAVPHNLLREALRIQGQIEVIRVRDLGLLFVHDVARCT